MQHAEKLIEIVKVSSEANNGLLRQYDLLAMKQLSLMQQVLAVMRKLEILRCHGTPLQASELR